MIRLSKSATLPDAPRAPRNDVLLKLLLAVVCALGWLAKTHW